LVVSHVGADLSADAVEVVAALGIVLVALQSRESGTQGPNYENCVAYLNYLQYNRVQGKGVDYVGK
jgi:hypothetical protein